MTIQLFIGLFTEGTTDQAFLKSIVEKGFIKIGMECHTDLEIFIHELKIEKTGLGFSEQVMKASKIGVDEFGISVLCVHTDSDDPDDIRAFEKISDALGILSETGDSHCKLVTPIVPVQMIEAWMLADKDLLRKEIGTDKSDNDLDINRNPETIPNPKIIIENAIRIAREDFSKRRRRDLTISELYQPIGQKIDLQKLEILPSFRKFIEAVRETYRSLNYLV
jgi:hypothetical protein